MLCLSTNQKELNDADSELDYSDDFQVLVDTLLDFIVGDGRDAEIKHLCFKDDKLHRFEILTEADAALDADF